MQQSEFKAATYMLAVRMISIVIGLAGIPILLMSLGEEGFSAWAILFGGSMAFYAMELGMSQTVIKEVAEKQYDGVLNIDSVLTNAIMLLVIVYAIGYVLIGYIAEPLTKWLHLPDTKLFTAAQLLIIVYIAVTGCSILKAGINTLYGAQRFDLVAIIALIQTLVANIITWIVAYMSQRLDLVILTYWLLQLLMFSTSYIIAKRIVPWQFNRALVNISAMRSLLSHGLSLQLSDLAHFVHYQFDKMIIAGFVGLSEVARYEVGSRAGQALRTLPANALGVFLPKATTEHASGGDIWGSYIELTRVTAHMAVIFLLVPLIVSPLFLFAWVGLVGYHGRWVFLFLAIGIMASVITLPISIFVQAMGQTVLEAKQAIATITLNIILSLILVQHWGKEGAAAGTGMAMLITSLVYMYAFHRIHQKRMRNTIFYLIKQLWPVLPISIVWWMFMLLVKPWVIDSRWYMAPAAVLLYITCVAGLLITYARTNRLNEDERQLLTRIPVLKWLL